MTSKKPAELVLVATSEKPAALVEAEKKTVENFNRREAQNSKRTYVAHAKGRAICEALLPDLAKFMLSPEAPTPPQGLESVIDEFQIKPEELALAALSLLLHYTAIERMGNDEKSQAMNLKLAMGHTLHGKCFMLGLLNEKPCDYERITKSDNRHRAMGRYWKDYRQSRWSDEQCVRAGNWLVDCVLQALPLYFALDDEKFPLVTEVGREFARRLSAELVYRDPIFPPATEPLQDWTDWRTGGYWSDTTRISASFVRDSHPATETAIRRAFWDGSMKQHVDGVTVLQRVPWTINAAMLPVVEKFAGKVGKKVSERQVVQDVAAAKDYGAKTFYVPMNCDFRGRVFGIPHFNFQREDHVRALFRFARGMPIGPYGDKWIMIHVANCADFNGLSKRPWRDRIKWVEDNIAMITRIAENPEDTVKEWRGADAPFSFVAACFELAAAREKGPNYITRLPVCFDGSCSGIQHLAMLMRDEERGKIRQPYTRRRIARDLSVNHRWLGRMA
jgi:DNA-dependent RNA polymerase